MSGPGATSPVGSAKFSTSPHKARTNLESKMRTVQFDGKKETATFGKLDNSFGDISITNSKPGTKSSTKQSIRNKSHGLGGANF